MRVRSVHTKYKHDAAGHVLAAVVADAFDDGHGARVADGKAFGGDAAHVRAPTGRTIEAYVAGDYVQVRFERRLLGRVDYHHAAGQTLTYNDTRFWYRTRTDSPRKLLPLLGILGHIKNKMYDYRVVFEREKNAKLVVKRRVRICHGKTEII